MWIDSLAEYGMFMAKFGTIFIALCLLIVLVFTLFMRGREAGEEHLEIKHINQKLDGFRLLISATVLPKKAFKKSVKAQKQKDKGSDPAQKKIYVINFDGDIRASQVNSLREEITAVLSIADQNDEVLLVLESNGGTVHGYGLAASQLCRIKDKGIKLTVAVDKVAASGGYMMACVADTIIAAPFAIIGSIGVLAQLPNFNRLLKKHDIDFEQIAAGQYKRTLTLFGENTGKDREKLQQELDETHALFKQFVQENRRQAEIEKIATGEHWYGLKAQQLGLIDKIQCSDDFICEAVKLADVYELAYIRKRPVLERIFSPAVKATRLLADRWQV